MSGKKPEKNRQKSNTLRCIIGFGAFAAALFCENKIEETGDPSVLLILLMLGLCLVILITLLPIAFRGFPDAIARKSNKGRSPSGGPRDGEAVDFFETHPNDTTYTDSHGTSWDNTFFDD